MVANTVYSKTRCSGGSRDGQQSQEGLRIQSDMYTERRALGKITMARLRLGVVAGVQEHRAWI